jgi:hypothetical protein
MNAGPVQTEKETGGSIMPLTHDFKETIRTRAQSDTDFRLALLREAVECLINGDLAVGKSVLRDYIHATVGFSRQSLQHPDRPAKDGRHPFRTFSGAAGDDHHS